MIKKLVGLGPDDAGMRLSAKEFAEADYQEPYIYERVRGRLVVMSPAGPDHRHVSRPFRRELGGYWHLHRDVVEDVDVAEYHAIRVKEYAIVDRFKESVLVLTWQEGDYAEQVLRADDEYTTPLLPGLTVALKEVFG